MGVNCSGRCFVEDGFLLSPLPREVDLKVAMGMLAVDSLNRRCFPSACGWHGMWRRRVGVARERPGPPLCLAGVVRVRGRGRVPDLTGSR
jgi:hypothetical protein